MSNFRFCAKLDDAVFVLVILAGLAVSAAMEIGALLPVFQQASDSIVARVKAGGDAASRVAAASAPSRMPGVRVPAKVGS